MNIAYMLEALIIKKDLSNDMIQEFFSGLLANDIATSQIASLLSLLRAKGHSDQEMSYFVANIIDKAIPITKPDSIFADIVGTGGDGFNTINVSTLASLTAASLGLMMAKHGNVAVSSKYGSADILRDMGVNIDLTPAQVFNSLIDNNWSFIFAPRFHPVFLALKEVRVELKIKTIFNVLGPLVNPLSPPIMLLGVYHEDLLWPFIKVLQHLKRQRALVVHGSGLDEIAIHGPTKALLLDNNNIESLTIHPHDLGLNVCDINEISNIDPKYHHQFFISVLKGEAKEAHLSFTSASAGMLLWLAHKYNNMKDAVSEAKEALYAQKPFLLLNKIKDYHHGSS